jgi:hypothetical protein
MSGPPKRSARGAVAAVARWCVAICAAILAWAPRADADTKIYRAAQVQFDVRDDWKTDTANDIVFVTDPKETVILVVQVLESSRLEKAIKDADTILKKYITAVHWHKKPTSRNLNGMKALAFDGSGVVKGDKVDIGALIVTTPSSKPMFIFGFQASSQSATLQPQVNALVESIRPAPAEPPRRDPAPAPRPTPTPTPGQPQAPPTTDAEGLPVAPGFSVHYYAPRSASLQPLLSLARNAGLERFIDEINQSFVWPRAIPIEIRECGVVNAYYNPYLHVVRLCYELVAEVFLTFHPIVGSNADALKLTAGAIKFTLMHELTHALIHELEIPIASREEDAADNFAAVLMTLEKDDTGFDSASAAARWFLAMGSTKLKTGLKSDDATWYDVHSFDLVRTNSILCLLYGADAGKYRRIVGDQIGPPRAYLEASCASEYRERLAAWLKLLSPHMKK